MISKKPLYTFRFIAFLLAIFSFTQCRTNYQINDISYAENQSINDQLTEDQYVVNFIEPYKEQIDSKLGEEIAVSTADLNDKGLSSNLGNLLADVVFDAANEYAKEDNLPPVDFVVLNHGGMRVDIGKGPVTINKVFELMPFENVLVLVSLKGSQLQELINYMLESKKGHPLSGIVLEYENGEVKQALVNGEKIDPNKTYVIATNNYLYNGGDSMDFFKPNIKAVETELKIRDIFLNEFKKLGTLPDIQEQRLIIK